MEIKKYDDDAIIHDHYSSQINPQPIELLFYGEDQKVFVDTNGEIGNSVSSDRWHGIDKAFSLPVDICSGAEVNRFMEKNKDLFESFLNSFESEWNGSNHVGKWNEDIEQEIEELCRGFESIWSCGDAGDYYAYERDSVILKRLKEFMSKGKTLADFVRDEEINAECENILVEGIEEYVQEILDNAEEE